MSPWFPGRRRPEADEDTSLSPPPDEDVSGDASVLGDDPDLALGDGTDLMVGDGTDLVVGDDPGDPVLGGGPDALALGGGADDPVDGGIDGTAQVDLDPRDEVAVENGLEDATEHGSADHGSAEDRGSEDAVLDADGAVDSGSVDSGSADDAEATSAMLGTRTTTAELSTEHRAVEAVVLCAVEPVPVGLLAELLELSPSRVEEICGELQADYRAQRRGFVLARVAGGYRLQTDPELAPYVERFASEGVSTRLSSAALETLAIIAYKQPVSRAQVATLRGVNVDGVVRLLHQRGLIEEVGHAPGPGQPILYGTTAAFLEKLGLDTIDQLPAVEDLFPGPEVVEVLEARLRPGGAGEDADVDPDAHTHAASDAEGDADAGSDVDSETQSVSDAEAHVVSDVDTDTDTVSDVGGDQVGERSRAASNDADARVDPPSDRPIGGGTTGNR
jgi:segregation and condensation protein B